MAEKCRYCTEHHEWTGGTIRPPILYRTQAGPHHLPGGWVWNNGLWQKQMADGIRAESWPLGWVRHTVDCGNVAGSNHPRNQYVPKDVIVVEDVYFPCPQCGFDRVFNVEDRDAIAFHEDNEQAHMPQEGASEKDYDKAHHDTNQLEANRRRELFGATCEAVKD